MKEFNLLLLSENKKIREFVTSFNPEKHILKAKYAFGIPKNKLITKKGMVSKTSLDVDNCVKPTQDGMFKFLKKYNKEIDDAYVTSFVAEKFISEDYVINLTLEIIDLHTILT